MRSERKIVSIDREAAKEAVVEAGRKARKSVTQKAAAGSSRARQRARQAGSKAVGKVSGKVAETRGALGREVQKRRSSALRRALRTCIALSKKQTAVLEKLAGSLSA